METTGMGLDLVRIIIMVVLIVAFLGMWAWAWSSKRKEVFDKASMLPLEEDDGRVPEVNQRAADEAGTDTQQRIKE